MAYKLLKDFTGKVDHVKFSDSTNIEIIIPFAPDNTDYQDYLKWVDEGNTAEAAD